MSWPEFAAARQLLAEEFVGTRRRAVIAKEDRDIAASKDAIRRSKRPPPGVHPVPAAMTNAIAGEPARRGVSNGPG